MGPPATHVAVGASATYAREQPVPASPPVPACPPPALLLPRVTCPRCQARPRLRFASTLGEACAGLDPGTLLATLRCRCGEIYALTAAALTDGTNGPVSR